MLADVYMQDCCAFPVPGNGEPAYDSAFRVPENGEPTRVLVPGNPEPICVPRSQERNPKLTPLPNSHSFKNTCANILCCLSV
jgi:hypothetical protein